MAEPALPTQRRYRSALLWVTVGVAVLAFVARLWPVERGGGLHGLYGYDDGVYYTSAAALLFGRVPYRDFVLLHPPGIMLLLTPFAALGRVTSDATGFAVARLAFMALGALNAALVSRILGRFGIVAAAAGGVFYALWWPSVYAERTTLLEPLGTTGLLVALLLLSRGRGPSVVQQWVAGVALGAAVSTKVWGVAPLLVVVLWQLRATGWRAAARLAGGAAAAATVVCLPFFLLAPAAMVRLVVLDQMLRPITNGSPLTRLIDFTGMSIQLEGSSRAAMTVGASVVLLVGAAAAVVAWRDRRARVLVVLLVACGFVLMASPSYFTHYGELVAGPAALVWGVAVGRVVAWAVPRLAHRVGRPTWQGGRAAAVTAVVVSLPVLLMGAVTVTHPLGTHFTSRLTSAVAGKRCVVADVPTGLIEVNALSRSLSNGCRVWVDMTGLTYDRDSQRNGTHAVSRLKNPLWQRDLLSYLTSGQATVFVNHPSANLSGDGLRRMLAQPLLASRGPYRVYGRP